MRMKTKNGEERRIRGNGVEGRKGNITGRERTGLRNIQRE